MNNQNVYWVLYEKDTPGNYANDYDVVSEHRMLIIAKDIESINYNKIGAIFNIATITGIELVGPIDEYWLMKG